MKRLGLYLLAAVMVAVPAGCGGGDGDDDDGWVPVVPVGQNYVPPPTPAPGPPGSEEVTIAKCLSSKGAVLYGASWCPYTEKQIASFKDGFQYLRYVECTTNPTLCQQKGINAYPTWLIGGSRILGYRAPTEIGSLAGCS